MRGIPLKRRGFPTHQYNLLATLVPPCLIDLDGRAQPRMIFRMGWRPRITILEELQTTKYVRLLWCVIIWTDTEGQAKEGNTQIHNRDQES